MQHARSSFPDEGLNPYPLPWKHRVPTTGLPGSLSLCPHWKELLIQVRVDLTTSSCSARVVSCFTPGPLHQKSVPGSGVKSGSILVGRGVCCKSRMVGKTTVSFQLPPSRSLLLSLFEVWDGICMSGMSTCATSPVCRGPSALLATCWRFLLSTGHPSFLTLSSSPPQPLPFPSAPSTNGSFVCPPSQIPENHPRFFFP